MTPRAHAVSSGGAVVTLLAAAAAATHSVVRYRWWIVAVYVLAAALLTWSLAGRGRNDPGTRCPLTVAYLPALLLAGAGIVTLSVPAFTYLDDGQALAVRWILAATAVLAAALLALPWRHGPGAALGIATGGYLAAAVTLVRLDPAPAIDVWITLQQGADGLLRGKNLYTQVWTDSPGVQDAFTYLPWTAVLVAPGRWLGGDVRWALVLLTLLAAAALWALGRHGDAAQRRASVAAACLVLLLPGTATQVEQAWTEPLLLACLAGWALSVQRGRSAVAVLCLALALASKQHIVLLLPVLAAWPGFGLRRAAAASGLAAVLVLPWFLASPTAMWHDTVALLVQFPPLRFANTLYLASVTELGRTPPFWLTGAVVLATVTVAAVAVHRRRPDVSQVLQWMALVLLIANLVNKQAFYNQYWLVMGLILVSWAVPAGEPATLRPQDPPLSPPGGRRAAAAT